MTRFNLSHLFFIAAGAAIPLLPLNAPAAAGDILESNEGMILRFGPQGGTPGTIVSDLANPKGIAFDGNGHFFVADANRGIVYRYNSADGSSPFAFASGLSAPVGVTFDALGFLYVTDAGSGTVYKFNTNDGSRTTFASGLGEPGGVAFDNLGNLFVADFTGGTIVKITPDGTKTTFASGLGLPAGLAIDSANNVFESDSDTDTIYKFAPDGSRSTFATGLDTPYGLAFEASGNLIEADHDSGTTYRFDPSGGRTVIFQSDFNTPQFVAVEPAAHHVLNISTRGFVEDGDHNLIAGFIIGGIGPVGTDVVVRALGPSLPDTITDRLPDPILQVRNSLGDVIGMNDNWQDAPKGHGVGHGFELGDPHEAGLRLTLPGGAYSVVVYGGGSGSHSGTTLVEVYHVQP